MHVTDEQIATEIVEMTAIKLCREGVIPSYVLTPRDKQDLIVCVSRQCPKLMSLLREKKEQDEDFIEETTAEFVEDDLA